MKKLILLLCIPLMSFGQLGEYYYSNGHPKSKGLNFQVKKPIGFEQNEGDRPNIVQKWEKNKTNNDEYVSFMIIVKRLPAEMKGFGKSEWSQYLKNDGGIEDFSSAFSNASNKEFLVIDGYPSVIFDASQNMSRLNFTLEIYFSQIMVIVDDYSFTMMFQATSKRNLQNNKRLFYNLANSVIFPDQYN